MMLSLYTLYVSLIIGLNILQIIRDSQSDKKNDVKDKLIVRIQVPKTLDKDMNSDLLGSSNSLDDLVVVESGGDHEGYIKICVRVFISYTGDQAATNVNVVPHVPNFVHCAPVTASFDRVAGSSSTPLIIKFYMYARKGQIPTGKRLRTCMYICIYCFLINSLVLMLICAPVDLSGQILVTYTSSTGDARVLSYPVPIPLFLACRLRPAVKSASFKYTLGPEYNSDSSASKVGDSVVLTEAFDDMLYATQESGIDVSELLGNLANYALGFEFYYTADVDSTEFEKVDVDGIGNSHVRSSNAPVIVTSVLLSKQTGRYRVQSTSMSGLLLIIKELEQRLVTKLDLISKRDRNSHASLPVITFTDTLPLNEFYEAITNHFETRKR